MQPELRPIGPETSRSSPSQEVEQCAEKYLTFRVASDTYVVPFNRVLEIMGIQKIRALPNGPVFLKGVFNLRGKILPVVDLRVKFGLDEREYWRRTCILITQIENETAGKVTMGIVIDSVAHVLHLKARDFHNGCFKLKGRVHLLLDLDMLFSPAEMDRLAAVCY
jgi:purine-binding chemotaxis protein CheW